ncbi:MAG: SDR family oxidoreductase [Chitinophagales bacterium]|nr:SDR family oxidoreductase [Chitinophagales bacterium]MDW8427739.1 SDR family oxidoreductase [Chitinophagales bacterium]
MNHQKKVVIVTGASSGIGRACALEFARRGYAVVLAARTASALQDVQQTIRNSGGDALSICTDVTQVDDCRRLMHQTVTHFGRIDVLVNNAGISMRALFSELKLDVLHQVMAVNFWGTVYCTYYALPELLKTSGSIVGVSSVAGLVGLPARTGYCASKFAMHGFLEALRIEHLYDRLHVLIVCPGYTASNIRNTALDKEGRPQGESPLEENRLMPPETVAKAIARGVEKRRRTQVLTLQGKATLWMKHYAPRWLDHLIYRFISKETDSPLRPR